MSTIRVLPLLPTSKPWRSRCTLFTASLQISPARTCTDAAAQARVALRRYREAVRPSRGKSDSAVVAAGLQPLPRRLKVWLPLPSPEKGGDGIYNYDDAEFPGGIQQRFRRLRPMVEEHLLAGYDPQVVKGESSGGLLLTGSDKFLGMLESPADGIGVWQAAAGDTTVVAQVGNQNFAPFARLCAGEFGARVLEPSHTILVINPTWTQSSDIGQLWDRKLKQQAASIIDDPSAWLPLYYLWDIRTAQGATGMLFRSWPHDWQLYHTTSYQEGPVAAFDEAPIMVSQEQPSRAQQVEALNSALRREKEAKKEARKL